MKSHDYWLATVWPDGRPHVMPLWGVWDEGALWFSCSPKARKARNLEADPRCSATTDTALEPVVMEGRAALEPAGVERFTGLVNAKYSTDTPVEFFAANALYRFEPELVIGLTEADFTGTPTRWRL